MGISEKFLREQEEMSELLINVNNYHETVQNLKEKSQPDLSLNRSIKEDSDDN
jgi:hypothetical protein